MSGGMHGGDEVGAIVLDFGGHTLRGGFAGEDCPKLDIPSHIGCIEESLEGEKKKKYYVGTNNISAPRHGLELTPLIKDGMVEDFDLLEKALDFMFSELIPGETICHPVLMSEPAWNSKAKRERLAEIFFEKYSLPAFYLAKKAVLTCFSAGRSTGLVLDSGTSHTSAVPVFDGLVLNQGVVRSPLAGDLIIQQSKRLIEEDLKIDVVPAYKIASKESVKELDPAKWKSKLNLPTVTQSYHNFMIRDIFQDFAASVLQVSDERYDQNQADIFPMVGYEFPNGYNLELGHERFQIPEILFDPTMLKENSSGNKMLSMVNTVTNSVNMCDIDIRPNLYGNVVIVGGNSLLQGFADRVQRDLNAKTPPSMRLKVNFSNTTADRRFSSWVGGSILGSLGTFHQMWISKQEYEESGKVIVEKKCA